MKMLKTFKMKFLSAVYSIPRILFINFYRIFVVRIKVFNTKKIPDNRSVIFAFNHTTGADPIVVLGALRKKIYFLAESERFKNKFSAFFMRNFTNSIPVFKEDLVKNFNSFKELFMLSKGKKVFFGVFPEGHLNKSNAIDKLQSGVAYLSYKTKLPIVPVYIHNIHKGLSLDSRLGKKPVWEGIFALFLNTFRRINIIIGDPIDPMAERIIEEFKEIKEEAVHKKPVNNINQALYDEFMELQIEANNLLKINHSPEVDLSKKHEIKNSYQEDYNFDEDESLIDLLDDEDFVENTGNAK